MRVIGTRVNRIDGIEKATGQALFTNDLVFPNMLYAAIVRSTEAHARILSIDTSAALSSSGVIGVYTAKDIPGTNICHVVVDDWPFLVDKVTKFIGEPIAVIVANSVNEAYDAINKVRVTYEPLPAVYAPLEALEPNAPKLNDQDNICSNYKVRRGNVEEGFKQADIIFEKIYTTQHQEHAYIEPQGCVVIPEPDGVYRVHGSMQCPFYVQQAVSDILNIGFAKVHVHQATVGGAFGGKEDVPSYPAGLCALAAYYTQKPVKLIFTREEDLIGTSKRHPSVVETKVGVKNDGTIVAAKIRYVINAGAYTTLSPIVLFRGTAHAVGPYRCDNVWIDGVAALTNTVPNGAYRGFGSPQVIFAHESLMDEIAIKLDIDPVELRKKNLLELKDTTITGQKLTESVGSFECLEKAAKMIQWNKKREEYKNQTGRFRKGIGLSTVYYGEGLGAAGKALDGSGALVQIHPDGTVLVSVGTTEMGQGAKTVFAQITADCFGIPIDKVHIKDTDTTHVPDSGPTVASRGTMMSGKAIINAAQKIKTRLFNVAQDILKTSDELIMENNRIYCKNNPDSQLELKDILKQAWIRNIHLAESGWYKAPEFTFWNNDKGVGDPYVCYAFSTHISEVEVDVKTGKVNVINAVCAHDVGRALNIVGLEGQIQGGYTQGLGYAIMEDLVLDKGSILSDNFGRYLIPTSKDTPEITTILVEKHYSQGPFGAKGIGEPPLMTAPPSVINAIAHACGARVRSLPVTAEKIYLALKKVDL